MNSVKEPNPSSVTVLHALPEAWREEDRPGEVAWPEVTAVAKLEMQCTACTQPATSTRCCVSAEKLTKNYKA